MKINLIDILAVLAVVGVGVFLFWFVFGGVDGREFDRYVYFTVEVREADAGFNENIVEGAPVRDTIFGMDIGTVYSVVPMPHREYVFNFETEQMEMSTFPEDAFEMIHVTIRSPGLDNGRALEIMPPNYEVRVGRELHFRGRGFQGYGFIIGIREEVMG